MEKYSSKILKSNRLNSNSDYNSSNLAIKGNFFPKPPSDFYCDSNGLNHFENEKKRLKVVNSVFKTKEERSTDTIKYKNSEVILIKIIN